MVLVFNCHGCRGLVAFADANVFVDLDVNYRYYSFFNDLIEIIVVWNF